MLVKRGHSYPKHIQTCIVAAIYTELMLWEVSHIKLIYTMQQDVQMLYLFTGRDCIDPELGICRSLGTESIEYHRKTAFRPSALQRVGTLWKSKLTIAFPHTLPVSLI